MKSLLLISSITLGLVAGCASGAAQNKAIEPSAVEAAAEPSSDDVAANVSLVDVGERQPGDFVVYRFSGSYRATPVEVHQRVLARMGDALLIRLEIEGGPSFELEVDDSPARRGALRSVTRLVNGQAEPVPVAVYEAAMAELVMAADENQGMLDELPVTLVVGDEPLAAIQTSYQVRVGDADAVMHTFAADGFAWGDVGGQILGGDGTVLYKAEVVQMGRGAAALAAQDPYEADEGLDMFDE